jgi:hypothetical protein
VQVILNAKGFGDWIKERTGHRKGSKIEIQAKVVGSPHGPNGKRAANFSIGDDRFDFCLGCNLLTKISKHSQ